MQASLSFFSTNHENSTLLKWCEPVGSNSLEPTIKLKPTQESQETCQEDLYPLKSCFKNLKSSQDDLDPLKSCSKNLDSVRTPQRVCFDKFLVQSRTSRENWKVFYEEKKFIHIQLFFSRKCGYKSF